MGGYKFTNTWFADVAKNNWDQIFLQFNPKKILEIGSYEGASTCYLIDKLGCSSDIEIHCVDTWEGGLEQKSTGIEMNLVESRFAKNTKEAISKCVKNVDLIIHKGFSDVCLPRLLCDYKNYFEFIYIDGSHEAPDVLCDAVLCFRLLKTGGIMAFDDYLGGDNKNPLFSPKAAIDAFTTLYSGKINIMSIANYQFYQIYVQKTSD